MGLGMEIDLWVDIGLGLGKTLGYRRFRCGCDKRINGVGMELDGYENGMGL